MKTNHLTEEQLTQLNTVVVFTMFKYYYEAEKSIYMGKWLKKLFPALLPDEVRVNEFGDFIPGILDVVARAEDKGIIKGAKPKGKLYKMHEVVNIDIIKKVLAANILEEQDKINEAIQAAYDSVEFSAKKAQDKRNKTYDALGW